MPMLAIVELAKKARNIFAKAIELLKLKFAKKHLVAVFFAVFIFVGVGLIIPQGVAHGISGLDTVGDWLMRNVLFRIVYAIFYVLFYAAYAISWIGAAILNTNLNPEIMTQVLKSSAITDGWAIFRDIANLFFILILLFIAIGTIVRSQSYNLKNLLPKLIIAVFLINFSAVIAKVIIDFGNIFMYGVLKWMSCPGNEECFTDFFSSLMTTVRVFWDRYQLKDILFPTAQDTIGLVIATIYTFLYGLILLALGTFLMIRIAAFALLIILSPLAFVGEVFPGMKELSSEWWKNLVNYTLFGPIFALLLYVSGLMARTVIEAPVTDSFYTDPALGTFGTLYVTIIQNIIPLIFLLAIIPITRKLGMYGADAAFSTSIGFGTAGVRFAGGVLDRFAARGAQPGYGGKRKVLSYFSPGAWKRAIKSHYAESERDYEEASGKMRRKFVQPATDYLRKSAVDYQDDAHQRDVAKHRGDVKGKNKDELVNLMIDALDKGIIARAEAIGLELATTGDMNEIATVMKDKDGNFYENTPEGFDKFMKDKFQPNLGEEKTARYMADLANLEKKDGNYSFKGSSKFDRKENKWKIATSAERDEVVASEFGKVEPQAKWRGLDSRTLLDQRTVIDPVTKKAAIDPTTGKEKKEWVMADRGKMIVENLTAADLANVRKGKPEHLRRIRSTLTPATMATFNPKQLLNAQNLADEIDRAISGTPGGTSSAGGPGAGGPGAGPTYTGTATAGGASGKVGTP